MIYYFDNFSLSRSWYIFPFILKDIVKSLYPISLKKFSFTDIKSYTKDGISFDKNSFNEYTLFIGVSGIGGVHNVYSAY